MGFDAISGPNWIVPTAPTADSSNRVADTAFVQSAIASAIATMTIHKQTFTTTGSFTYTPTARLIYCIVEAIGGGGAGGGVAGNAADWMGGGGGGGGGYSRAYVLSSTIGTSQVGTVGAPGTPGSAGSNPGGAGGDSSLAAICVGKGGGGGFGGSAASVGTGGLGGISGTGDITIVGGKGTSSLFSTAVVLANAGLGGGTVLGSITPSPVVTNANGTSGIAGAAFGSGGSGGIASGTTGSFQGGAGATGGVIITEFCAV